MFKAIHILLSVSMVFSLSPLALAKSNSQNVAKSKMSTDKIKAQPNLHLAEYLLKWEELEKLSKKERTDYIVFLFKYVYTIEQMQVHYNIFKKAPWSKIEDKSVKFELDKKYYLDFIDQLKENFSREILPEANAMGHIRGKDCERRGSVTAQNSMEKEFLATARGNNCQEIAQRLNKERERVIIQLGLSAPSAEDLSPPEEVGTWARYAPTFLGGTPAEELAQIDQANREKVLAAIERGQKLYVNLSNHEIQAPDTTTTSFAQLPAPEQILARAESPASAPVVETPANVPSYDINKGYKENQATCLFGGHVTKYSKVEGSEDFKCNAPEQFVDSEACLSSGAGQKIKAENGTSFQCNTFGLSNDLKQLQEGIYPPVCVNKQPLNTLTYRCMVNIVAWLRNNFPVGLNKDTYDEFIENAIKTVDRFEKTVVANNNISYFDYCSNPDKIEKIPAVVRPIQVEECNAMNALFTIIKDKDRLYKKILTVAEGRNSKAGRAVYQYIKETQETKTTR